MTLPNLYLLGAPKAGTTSLAHWLGEHPQVFWSVPKEPYFWASDYPGMRAHYGFESREAYEALFASAEAQAMPVRGDGSTTYLYSENAVPDIREVSPDARFIVCVRNPVDLLVSYHRTQIVALNEDEPDFATAWRRSLAGERPDTNPLDPKLLDYPTVGGLGRALGKVMDVVPRDQLHVVLFDDLRADAEDVWRSLARFVGIDHTHRPALQAYNASNKMFRSRLLQHMNQRPPRVLHSAVRELRQWSRNTQLVGVRAAKTLLWREADRPEASPKDRREVFDYFRRDVAHLGELIDRDLTGWHS